MKKILLSFLIFAITSCSAVNGYLVSEKKEGWFNGIRVSDLGPSSPFSFLNPFVQRGFMYCKANDSNDSGLADPVCYKVRYSTYLNEKSNYLENKDYNDSASKSLLDESAVQHHVEKNNNSNDSQTSTQFKKNKTKR